MPWMQGYPIGLLAVDRLVDNATWHCLHCFGPEKSTRRTRKKLEAVSSCCYNCRKLQPSKIVYCMNCRLLSAATDRSIFATATIHQSSNHFSQPATRLFDASSKLQSVLAIQADSRAEYVLPLVCVIIQCMKEQAWLWANMSVQQSFSQPVSQSITFESDIAHSVHPAWAVQRVRSSPGGNQGGSCKTPSHHPSPVRPSPGATPAVFSLFAPARDWLAGRMEHMAFLPSSPWRQRHDTTPFG